MLGYNYVQAAIKAFHDKETPATVLHAILLDVFETAEYVTWDPETVGLEYTATFNSPWEKVPMVNKQKIMFLCSAILAGNNFFRSLSTFIPTCNVLNNTRARLDIFDPATMEEMAWAVTEVYLLGEEEEFGYDIQDYVGAQATIEGFKKLPKILKWGTKPKRDVDKELRAAADDADMFAAGYRDDRDKVARVEAGVQKKAQAMLGMLASFPFVNRME